jgi:hypothetical protein
MNFRLAGESEVVEEKTIRDKVIDALGIPSQKLLLRVLHLPDRKDIINYMFSTFPTSKTYMISVLKLDDCINQIVTSIPQFNDKADELILFLIDQIPLTENIVSDFKEEYPTKEEIIDKLQILTKKDILSKLQYPCTIESVCQLLYDIINKEEVQKKLNLPTRKVFIEKLDQLKARTSSPALRLLISRTKDLVPDIITSSVIIELFPDSTIKNDFLSLMTSEILIPINDIIDMIELPNKKEIVNAINDIDDRKFNKDNVLKLIPDISCKKNIKDLFTNIIVDRETLFESFNIPSTQEIYEKLNVDKICETYELPLPTEILSILNIPSQTAIIKTVKNNIPSASDFIDSLDIPNPLQIANKIYNQFDVIDSDIKIKIANILFSTMEQVPYYIQDRMGLNDVNGVISALKIRGYMPPSNAIISALNIPTYAQMAAKLNLAEDNRAVDGIKQFLLNNFNYEEMTSDGNVHYAKDFVDAMIGKVTPKNVKEFLGDEMYNQLSEAMESITENVDEVVDFLKTGNLTDKPEESSSGEESNAE